MAVTFVIGNAHRISPSLLAPGTTISAIDRQRIHRGGRRSLHLVADRARPDPVRHHLHRSRRRATHADAARSPGGEVGPMPAQISPIHARRHRRNAIWMGLCVAAAAFGLTRLAHDPRGPRSGRAFAVCRSPFSPNDAAARAASGGLLNAIVGSLIMTSSASPIGDAARAFWRAPIWPNTAATRGSRLSCASSTTSCSARRRSWSACSSMRSWSRRWGISRRSPAASRWPCWWCRSSCARPRTC